MSGTCRTHLGRPPTRLFPFPHARCFFVGRGAGRGDGKVEVRAEEAGTRIWVSKEENLIRNPKLAKER